MLCLKYVSLCLLLVPLAFKMQRLYMTLALSKIPSLYFEQRQVFYIIMTISCAAGVVVMTTTTGKLWQGRYVLCH